MLRDPRSIHQRTRGRFSTILDFCKKQTPHCFPVSCLIIEEDLANVGRPSEPNNALHIADVGAAVRKRVDGFE